MPLAQVAGMSAAQANPEFYRDDAVLVRLRAGDEATFAWLVDSYANAMLHVARAHVRDDATANDVVQDTWMAVLRGLATYEGRGSLKGWIFAILVNRAKTRGVREARAVPFSSLVRDEAERDEPSVDPSRFAGPGATWPRHWEAEPAPWGDHPEQRLLGLEVRAEIEAAIAKLPEAQRTVVIMRDLTGEPVTVVCERLGISEANARVLLHRARAKIRTRLETYFAAKGAAA